MCTFANRIINSNGTVIIEYSFGKLTAYLNKKDNNYDIYIRNANITANIHSEISCNRNEFEQKLLSGVEELAKQAIKTYISRCRFLADYTEKLFK